MNCTVCGMPFVIGGDRNLHKRCREREDAAGTVVRRITITDASDAYDNEVLLLMGDGSVRWEVPRG